MTLVPDNKSKFYVFRMIDGKKTCHKKKEANISSLILEKKKTNQPTEAHTNALIFVKN